MAAKDAVKEGHPFHLVNPSPWPILMSLALFCVTFGLANYMHEKPIGLPLMSAGILLVLTFMYTWWRDVVKESRIDKAHSGAVSHGLRAGMLLFIISEVMFFFAFFFAFFNASTMPKEPLTEMWEIAVGVWPPKGIATFDPWHVPFINTLILLLSGTTVTWAHHALMNGDRKGMIQGLVLTVVLGVIFSTLQAYEYHHAAFGFKDGIYASTFYMATGFHGAHVIIGTIFLAVCLVRAMKGHFDEPGKNHLGFEFAAWYWHFVDVVWLFLFTFVYVWGA